MTLPAIAAGARLCSLGDVPDGGARAVTLGEGEDQALVVLLRHGGEVTAFHNRCPHFQIPMNPRGREFVIAGDGLLMCGYHAAVFRFADGVCIDGPCKGAKLQPVAVRREGDEILAA